jgi:hypothetical protein
VGVVSPAVPHVCPPLCPVHVLCSRLRPTCLTTTTVSSSALNAAILSSDWRECASSCSVAAFNSRSSCAVAASDLQQKKNKATTVSVLTSRARGAPARPPRFRLPPPPGGCSGQRACPAG